MPKKIIFKKASRGSWASEAPGSRPAASQPPTCPVGLRESVSVTDLLADSLALTGSATLDGLTAQGNVGCDQLLCNDVNCTDVFTTGVDASGAISCAALTATGAVAGAALTSTGAVSGSSLSISGAASVGLLSSATGITGSTLTINNTAKTITGAASAGPLDCESLDCAFTATSGGVSTGSVVCGDATSSGTVSAPQLFASNTLTVTNTSDFSDDLFLTKNWAGWSKLQVSNNSAAPDSGPELRLLGNQSARVFLERDGGTHQCELIMISWCRPRAVPDHEPEEPRLPRDRGQHGQRGLQHELHEFVGQPGQDGDGGHRRGGAPAALRLRGGQAVQAPDMNEDLRLGFASDDFVAGTKWKNLTGTARWSDGAEMVTLDHSHTLQGVQGLPGPAGRGGSLASPAEAEEQVGVSRPP